MRVSLARASCAVDLPSRRSSQRRRCLRFASLAFPHRRAPQAPSSFACVARRHDGVPNHSHFPRAPVPSARACFAFDLFSHRSSPRRSCLSLASLVFLISACASGADGFARVARRCASILSHPHVFCARVMSARASCAFDLPPRRCRQDGVACVSNLSRSDLNVCAVGLRSRRSSSQRRPKSLARLSLACRRRAPPAPSIFPLVARHNDAAASVSDLSRSHLGVCLGRCQSLLASLVVSTAP